MHGCRLNASVGPVRRRLFNIAIHVEIGIQQQQKNSTWRVAKTRIAVLDSGGKNNTQECLIDSIRIKGTIEGVLVYVWNGDENPFRLKDNNTGLSRL